MTPVSRVHRWLSPACAVPRLRALYFAALGLCAVLLVLLHLAIAGEHHLETALTAATH